MRPRVMALNFASPAPASDGFSGASAGALLGARALIVPASKALECSHGGLRAAPRTHTIKRPNWAPLPTWSIAACLRPTHVLPKAEPRSQIISARPNRCSIFPSVAMDDEQARRRLQPDSCELVVSAEARFVFSAAAAALGVSRNERQVRQVAPRHGPAPVSA